MFTKADAEAYFNGEKSQSLLFIMLGLAAIVLAVILLLVYKTNFFKGMAIPLIAIGVLQTVVGYVVHSRSDAQRMDIVYKMDLNPAAIRTAEIPRMEKVIRSFKVYKVVEIVLLAAGIILWVFFQKNGKNPFWAGLGLALAIQAALMFAADGFAEKRNKQYLEGIKAWLSPKAG